MITVNGNTVARYSDNQNVFPQVIALFRSVRFPLFFAQSAFFYRFIRILSLVACSEDGDVGGLRVTGVFNSMSGHEH